MGVYIRRKLMGLNHTHTITVGEVGNEIGHESRHHHQTDDLAIENAKRLCRPYKGDGWWSVERADGFPVADGGRFRL